MAEPPGPPHARSASDTQRVRGTHSGTAMRLTTAASAAAGSGTSSQAASRALPIWPAMTVGRVVPFARPECPPLAAHRGERRHAALNDGAREHGAALGGGARVAFPGGRSGISLYRQGEPKVEW